MSCSTCTFALTMHTSSSYMYDVGEQNHEIKIAKLPKVIRTKDGRKIFTK